MAVAVVASAGLGNNTTVSIDCTGANALVAACSIAFYNTLQTVTMTYNGVSMSAETNSNFTGVFWQIYTFSLANPASGANNLVYSGPTSGGNVGGVAVSGADTADVVQGSAQGSGSGTSVSTTVSSATDDLVIDFVTGNSAGTTSGSNTEQFDVGQGSYRLLCSTAPGAASVDMTWTLSTSQTWRTVGLNVKASGGGGGGGGGYFNPALAQRNSLIVNGIVLH